MIKKAELVITNDDTFLCVRVSDDLKAVVLPGIEVTSMTWVSGDDCRMSIQGPIVQMCIIDTLPVPNEAGETFMLELRANPCGDHISLSDYDMIVLTMTNCAVEYKHIDRLIVRTPPPAVVMMRACISGKLTLMDLMDLKALQ